MFLTNFYSFVMTHILKLNNFPEFYIGFLLDIIKEHFCIDGKCTYHIMDYAPLNEVRSMCLISSNKSKISIRKYKSSIYAIDGLPENIDFQEFRKSAQSKLLSLIHGKRKVMGILEDKRNL